MDDVASCEALSGYSHHIVQEAERGCVAAWNLAAVHSRGRLLVQLSDDWEPVVGWDESFLAKLSDLDAPKVLRVSDGIRWDDLLWMAICTRARYEEQGFFLAPVYFGLYSNDEFSFRAYQDGVVVDARDLVFRHVHGDHDKTVALDGTCQRQNALWREIQGRQLFISRNPGALRGWLHLNGRARRYVPPGNLPNADATLPCISVIMRTHNRPQFMRRALESIAQQSYPEIELVVVAYGDALTYARELLQNATAAAGFHARIIPAASGSSLGGMLNQGIAAATGRWIIALDDDDTWHHTCLERLATVLLTQVSPVSRAAACQYLMIHETLSESGEVVESYRAKSGEEVQSLLITRQIGRNQIVIHGFLFEKSLWSEIGGYREDLPGGEDWDFNLRSILLTDIILLPETLAYYHIRQNTLDQTHTAGRQLHFNMQAHMTNCEVRQMTASPEGRSQLFLAGQLSLAISELRDEIGRLRSDLELNRKRETSLQERLSVVKEKLRMTKKQLKEEKESTRAIRKLWVFKLLNRLRF